MPGYKKSSYKKKQIKKAYKPKMYKQPITYDGTIAMKIVEESPLIFNTASNLAHLSVQWGTILPSGTSPSMKIDDAPEFNNRAEKFKYIAIDKLQIEFHPLRNVSGSTERSISRLIYCTSLNEVFSRVTTL